MNEKGNSFIINDAILADVRLHVKEIEKMEKYLDLKIERERDW